LGAYIIVIVCIIGKKDSVLPIFFRRMVSFIERNGNHFAFFFKGQNLFFISITGVGNGLGYFYLKVFLHGMNRRLKVFKVIRVVGNLHGTYQVMLGIYH